VHWQLSEMSVVELREKPEKLVVDARSYGLYEKEHIPGAIQLSEVSWDEALSTFLNQWQPERSVVIYCDGHTCEASKRVALRLLQNLPEARVYVLKGGFPAWKATQK
jgi:rhodanese-related sulfurtransferase